MIEGRPVLAVVYASSRTDGATASRQKDEASSRRGAAELGGLSAERVKRERDTADQIEQIRLGEEHKDADNALLTPAHHTPEAAAQASPSTTSILSSTAFRTAESGSPAARPSSPSDSAPTTLNSSHSSHPSDPLRWYGMQIPPSLRDAQTSFFTAVCADVPAVLELRGKIVEVEGEIGRARKRLLRMV